MEELLRIANVQLGSFNRGDKIQATITKVSKREILADINAKSYGVIIGREFEDIQPLLSLVKEGKTYEAEVIIPEMESGDTLISLRKTLESTLWENLKSQKEKGEEVMVTVFRVVSGGVLVECFGTRGFIPLPQLDPDHQVSPEGLVDKRIPATIIEVDRDQNRLVLSEKEVTRKDELAAMRKALVTFEKGETVEGEVTAIERNVLKVAVTKRKVRVQGIVHISEVSWERTEDLAREFKAGDTIKAEVVDFDMQEAVLTLSMKRLKPDPWSDIEKKYPAETEISGTIVKVTGLGVFVELEKGVEGLLHVSKLPAEKEFKEGEKIAVVIDKLDKENRKISLSYVSVTKPIGYR